MRFRERVNGGRLRSLVLETQLYIFARQCALNLELKKPAEVARLGGVFAGLERGDEVGTRVMYGLGGYIRCEVWKFLKLFDKTWLLF